MALQSVDLVIYRKLEKQTWGNLTFSNGILFSPNGILLK